MPPKHLQPVRNQATKEYLAGLDVISSNIRALRAMRGLSQIALAKATGLSQSRITQIERHSFRIPLTAIYNIATAMGVAPDTLLRPGAYTAPAEAGTKRSGKPSRR